MRWPMPRQQRRRTRRRSIAWSNEPNPPKRRRNPPLRRPAFRARTRRWEELKDNKQLAEASKYIDDGHQEILRPFVKDWYAAGCKNVWFSVARNFEGKGVPTGVIVELPKDKAARAKCYDILMKYYDAAQITYQPADMKDDGKQFMSVGIRSAR